MSTLSKLFVLFTLALSVNSLATPHVVRSPHGHHALAARIAVSEAVPAVEPYGEKVKVVKPKRKRGDTGRCRAKSSSAVTSSSSSHSEAPTSVASSTSSSHSEAPTTPVAAAASFSSSTAAPEPTPSPSSSKKASSSRTSSSNAASSTSGSNSGGLSFLSGTQTGEATFYAIGLGACGKTNGGDDKIAAVSKLLFDQYPGYNGVDPNSNAVCGKSITLTYQGKSTTVTVEDRCEACALTDLDLSPTAFDDIADPSVGRLFGMTWDWAE